VINKALESVEKIVVHYPGLLLLNTISSHILQRVKISVFYVAPGYPNKSIPWILSNEIKSMNVAQTDIKYKSSYKMLETTSLISGNPYFLLNLLRKSSIYAMWNPKFVSLPDSELHVKHLGVITESNKKIWAKIPDKIKDFLNNVRDKLVYLSLGTFKINPSILSSIVKGLVENGRIVLVHGNISEKIKKLEQKYTESIFTFSQFIPHEFIVPRVSLIVTSGSICMTGIANNNGVPLIYAPILNEQLFWAKNYKYKTGQDFIKLDKKLTIKKQVTRILNSTIDNIKLLKFTQSLVNKDKIDYALKLVNYIRR
jgi:UDP:flavonoid glycosyltransferase YjiC (YdhE family)